MKTENASGKSEMKGEFLMITVPSAFKEVLEAERKRLGYRSVAEVARERLGCPQPGSDAWDEMLSKGDKQS